MTRHARKRHICRAAGCIALFVITGLFAGCAGGPKFSSLSPADWPGVKQVRGAGKTVGGWVAEQAQPRETNRKADSRVAQAATSPVSRQKSTNEKLKSIFAAAAIDDKSHTTDPFLAQSSAEEPSVESASQFDDASAGPRSTGGRRQSEFRRVNHALEGAEVSTPEAPTETKPVDNPFADFASEPKVSAKPPAENATSKSFADGIDAQIKRLREEANAYKKPKTSDTPAAENNPLRDAIFGTTQQEKSDLIAALPDDFEPATTTADRPVLEGPFADVKRDVDRVKEAAADTLPEWAREAPEESALNESPVPQKSLPVETTETTEIESPFAELPQEPMEDSIEEPFETNVAETVDVEPVPEPAPSEVDDDVAPPAAIEIVPFNQNYTESMMSDIDSAEVANSDVDDDPTQRVELLPAPDENDIATATAETGQRKPQDDIASSMIVESDSLPLGFVDWDESGVDATADIENGLESTTVTTPTYEEIPTRLAVKTAESNSAASSFSTGDADVPFGDEIEQPRFLREIPEPQIVDEKSAEAETPSTLDPHLFDSSTPESAISQSSLETVNWGNEPKTVAESAASSSYGSTAVIALLIAISCLVGLGLIRRLRAA